MGRCEHPRLNSIASRGRAIMLEGAGAEAKASASGRWCTSSGRVMRSGVRGLTQPRAAAAIRDGAKRGVNKSKLLDGSP